MGAHTHTHGELQKEYINLNIPIKKSKNELPLLFFFVVGFLKDSFSDQSRNKYELQTGARYSKEREIHPLSVRLNILKKYYSFSIYCECQIIISHGV